MESLAAGRDQKKMDIDRAHGIIRFYPIFCKGGKKRWGVKRGNRRKKIGREG